MVKFSFIFFVLFFISKQSFAQKYNVDVVKLNDDNTLFGQILQNSLNDSVILISSVSGDSILISKNTIVEKLKLKYEFEDHKIKVVNNNPYSSTFLSFLLTGSGQFYNDQYWKGSAQLGIVLISGIFTNGIKPFYIYDYSKKLNWADYLSIAVQVWSIIDAPISSVNINNALRQEYDDYFKQIETDKNFSIINQNKIQFSVSIGF